MDYKRITWSRHSHKLNLSKSTAHKFYSYLYLPLGLSLQEYIQIVIACKATHVHPPDDAEN